MIETPTSERPLVTFALFAYNQEQYIREAIEGAFSQTYEPLEIILSDDCSSDRTFEIMQEMAAAYDGPHNVVINRNDKNMGLINHVNHLIRLSKGEYIVVAAGDDISASKRTELTVTRMLKSGALLVHSNITEIYDDEIPPEPVFFDPTFWTNITPQSAADSVSLYIGATGVWRKFLFTKYGDIIVLNSYEDLVLGYRASLEGKIEFVNESLVHYRIGSGISHTPTKAGSREALKAFYLRTIASQIASLEQRLLDTKRSGHEDEANLTFKIQRKIEFLQAKKRFYLSPAKFIFFDSWRPFILKNILRSVINTILRKMRHAR